MSRLLFSGPEKTNREFGFGDAITYNISCDIKAKELGYKDYDIVFPRFIGGSVFQKSKYWNFLPNNIIPDYGAYDDIIDLTKSDILYKGYKGIANTGIHLSLFHSYYYNKTKDIPHLNFKRNPEKKYILFQYRDFRDPIDRMKELRNTPDKEFRYYYRLIKSMYPNHQLWKIGEDSPLDNKFDKVHEIFFELDRFIELMGNASLYLGGQCGPTVFAFYFKDLPIIRYGTLRNHDWYYEDNLKNIVGNIEVHKFPNWCDDRMINLVKGTKSDKLGEFLNKYIR
jgi:hypothetical protein